jgi:hypothetical protein
LLNSIVCACCLRAADGLGTYDGAPAAVQAEAMKEKQAELEKLGAEVVSAATEFGDEAAGFAKAWTKRLLESGSAAAESEFVLIEECMLDSDACDKLEDAIKKMQLAAGSDWAGTAC